MMRGTQRTLKSALFLPTVLFGAMLIGTSQEIRGSQLAAGVKKAEGLIFLALGELNRMMLVNRHWRDTVRCYINTRLPQELPYFIEKGGREYALFKEFRKIKLVMQCIKGDRSDSFVCTAAINVNFNFERACSRGDELWVRWEPVEVCAIRYPVTIYTPWGCCVASYTLKKKHALGGSRFDLSPYFKKEFIVKEHIILSADKEGVWRPTASICQLLPLLSFTTHSSTTVREGLLEPLTVDTDKAQAERNQSSFFTLSALYNYENHIGVDG